MRTYDYGNRDTGATYVRNYADDADTNQLESDATWEYTYDDEGNLTKKSQGAYDETWIYGYDHANHLNRAEKWSEDPDTMGTPVLQMEAEYRYDVYGNRIEKDVDKDGAGVTFSNVVTRFAIDGWNPTKPSPIGNENNDVFADLNGSSSLTTRYLRGDAVDQLLARIDGSDPRWHLTDHLGSVRDIIDNTGTPLDSLRYDSFGNIDTGTELDDEYRGRYAFSGREFDVETQLQYNRARYYDAATGRWISQDPLGFDAGDSNLYRYVRNQASHATDPSGNVIFILDSQGSKDEILGYLNSLFPEGKLTLKQKGDGIVERELWRVETNGKFDPMKLSRAGIIINDLVASQHQWTIQSDVGVKRTSPIWPSTSPAITNAYQQSLNMDQRNRLKILAQKLENLTINQREFVTVHPMNLAQLRSTAFVSISAWMSRLVPDAGIF